MRVTSYFATFVAVALSSLLVRSCNMNLSTKINFHRRTFCRRQDQTGATDQCRCFVCLISERLVVKYKEVLYTTITLFYGLSQRCQLQVIQTEDGRLSYRDYECRDFPTTVNDHCDKDEYKYFCIAWTSAYYLDQIALGIGAVALVTVLFGVTTHSRRRRIWRTVAGLVFLAGKRNFTSSCSTCQTLKADCPSVSSFLPDLCFRSRDELVQ